MKSAEFQNFCVSENFFKNKTHDTKEGEENIHPRSTEFSSSNVSSKIQKNSNFSKNFKNFEKKK